MSITPRNNQIYMFDGGKNAHTHTHSEGKHCAYINKSIVKWWKLRVKFYKVFPLRPFSFHTKISEKTQKQEK